jgi:anti-sigma regulatory factor (Ser/Thr protein kinase)
VEKYLGGASQPASGASRQGRVDVPVMARAWRIRRGDFAAASVARREFAAYLHVQATDQSKHSDAELIFGEIVSNAVRCANSSVEIELSCGSWANLRVMDDGDCFDESRIALGTPDAENGRGLYIAKSLARDFSLSMDHGLCTISVTLPVGIPLSKVGHGRPEILGGLAAS